MVIVPLLEIWDSGYSVKGITNIPDQYPIGIQLNQSANPAGAVHILLLYYDCISKIKLYCEK